MLFDAKFHQIIKMSLNQLIIDSTYNSSDNLELTYILPIPKSEYAYEDIDLIQDIDEEDEDDIDLDAMNVFCNGSVDVIDDFDLLLDKRTKPG